MKKIFTLVFVITITGLIVLGCGQSTENGNSDTTINPAPAINQPVNQPDSAGSIQQVDGPAVVKINDILKKSSDYLGKEVIIEGKIVQECGAGCWFNLKDSTGVIYVDLAPSNLTIPQKVGSNARVYGVVTIEKKSTYIIGKKVEFI